MWQVVTRGAIYSGLHYGMALALWNRLNDNGDTATMELIER